MYNIQDARWRPAGPGWGAQRRRKHPFAHLRQAWRKMTRAERRRALLKALDLPERLSPNAMLEVLNALFTPEELAEAASEKIFRENEKKT